MYVRRPLWSTRRLPGCGSACMKPVDVKGNSVDVKGNSVDVKGNSVDVKGNSVDVKGNSVDRTELQQLLHTAPQARL
eukprot:1196383-Prorocentrum_minimum.AAC.3